jgi:hypothetical protein
VTPAQIAERLLAARAALEGVHANVTLVIRGEDRCEAVRAIAAALGVEVHATVYVDRHPAEPPYVIETCEFGIGYDDPRIHVQGSRPATPEEIARVPGDSPVHGSQFRTAAVPA